MAATPRVLDRLLVRRSYVIASQQPSPARSKQAVDLHGLCSAAQVATIRQLTGQIATEIGLQGSGGRSSCQWPVALDFRKQSRTPRKELSMEKGLVPLVLWIRRTKVTVNALFIFACFSCAIVLCHSEQIFVACINFGLSQFKIRGSI
ncbi:unnamed protein product [Musa acuminata subsp. malaccensis]|uniref:(wild Malaysian banana) hypothetical protein n=1 Tax=Musa acuminata subsp. malaccensis TaxID=214687 RepID=A0A804KIH1_MUSAM|nr:unnamed protein product [Musa acuminata subsp. malaccensis]